MRTKTVFIEQGDVVEVVNEGAIVATLEISPVYRSDLEIVVTPVEQKRRWKKGRYYINTKCQGGGGGV